MVLGHGAWIVTRFHVIYHDGCRVRLRRPTCFYGFSCFEQRSVQAEEAPAGVGPVPV